LKKNGSYRIGLLIPKTAYESGYWKQIYEGVQKGVEEFAAFNFSFVLFEFNRSEVTSLENAFKELSASDCNAWIIAPVMQQMTVTLIRKCTNTKPYCFIDSALPEADSFCAVYQDPYKAGVLAAKLTALVAKKYDTAEDAERKSNPMGKTFAILLPYTEAYNLNKRAEGFCSWFSKNNEGEAIKLLSKDSTVESVKKELDALFESGKNIGGICTANAVAHIVAHYVENKIDAKKESPVRPAITGFDLVPENCNCLREETLDCLISQNPVEQGKIAVREVYKKLVLDEETDAVVEMPLEIYFKENLL
jgi:LacI family transcriptional regulator